MMSLSKSLPHRRSMRLPEFDYSQPGAYFVTIVTHGHEPLLDQIVEGEVMLNEVGKLVSDVWLEIPEHFPNVELGEFVDMSNHVHRIISITVEATHASPLPSMPWVFILKPRHANNKKGSVSHNTRRVQVGGFALPSP